MTPTEPFDPRAYDGIGGSDVGSIKPGWTRVAVPAAPDLPASERTLAQLVDSLLGKIFFDPSKIPNVLKILDHTDLPPKRGNVLKSCIATYANGEGLVNHATVTADLERRGKLAFVGGPTALVDLSEREATAVGIRHLAREIKAITLKRKGRKLHTEAAKFDDAPEARKQLRKVEREIEQLDDETRLPPYVLTRLDQVTEQAWEWFMEDRIPFGALTLLGGRPGIGKSAAMHDLIARASIGATMPDGTTLPPMNSLLLNFEDDHAKTLSPRILAAGGDLARVETWDRVRLEDKLATPNVVDHLAALEQIITDRKIRLVVIDPLMTFLAQRDSNSAQDMAQSISELQDLMAKHDVACVAINHLTKGSRGGHPVERTLGSIAIAGVCRAGLQIFDDPDDPESRLMAQSKANNSKEAAALRYCVVEGFAPSGASTAKVDWTGFAQGVTAQTLAFEDTSIETKGDRCELWLRELLGDCPRPKAQVVDLGEGAGFNSHAIQRAFRNIGGTSEKGFQGSTLWGLK